MAQILPFLVGLSLAVIGNAHQFYYARPHAWGVDPTVINAIAKQNDSNVKKIQATKKTSVKDQEVGLDDFETAEETIFHAVEELEDKLIHAIDDEVETLFPHHMDSAKK